MKDNTAKQNEDGRYTPANNEPDEDIKWFKQFDDNPGIYDVLNEVELVRLKNQMLSNIKAEINKKD